ncbi:MAG: porin family protein [Pseudomonadaceae bacterium]|nr:porin family protein [Pseudomonadaceae bacterium]
MKFTELPRIGLVALAVSVSAPVLADQSMNYNYIEGSYIDTEIDNGLDVDGDGFGLSGSVELGSNYFLTASYSAQEFDFGVDLDQKSIGFGGFMGLSDSVDLVGSINYVDAEIDTRFGSADDSGFGLGVGLRARVAPNVELEGGINYVDLDESGDDTSLALGGRYYLTEAFALGAGVSFGDDVTSWNLGARFEF